MHEARLFERLRAALESIARREAPARIVRARIRLGPLSHVTARRLEESWPEITKGTAASDAQLEVETTADVTEAAAADLEIVSVDLGGP